MKNRNEHGFDTSWERAESLCGELSREEKIAFIQGYERFFIRPVPRLKIPYIYMTDASQGIHIRPELGETMIRQAEKTVAYPCLISLAATWNPDLTYSYAHSIGEECRASGIHVLLGPSFNIYRNAQNGRNFEYMGEDPYLISRLVEQYVPGMQDTGTMATLKHFICNNSDFYRRRSNSVVSERALREIYMPAFKAGIDAGAKSLMTSYNLLNGEWCGQSSYVIKELIRKELGFKWLVMTDWTSVWDSEKVIHSGQDLVMPGPDDLKNLTELLEDGVLQEEQIDRMVKSIMASCIAMGFYDRDQKAPEMEAHKSRHVETALQTAREGMVLLKNDGILPLDSDREILLTGKYAEQLASGGGSGCVEGYDKVSMKAAMEREFGKKVQHKPCPGDEDIRQADCVILSIGTEDSEGWDRSFTLPREEEAWIEKVCQLNPNTIIVVNSGSGIAMTSWMDSAAAIIYAWYPGQNGNTALAEILSGKCNPSGKLPMTIEKQFSNSPAADYLPEGEKLYTGWLGENEYAHPIFDISYREDIFVGYRWFEKKGIEPAFPFGHGLSYSDFTYSDLKTDKQLYAPGEEVEISFTLENRSPVEGMETAQIYVSDVECSFPRPPKELKGFRKVSISPSEKQEIRLTLGKEAFSFWNPETRQWTLEAGEFEILLGSSSADIRLTKRISFS